MAKKSTSSTPLEGPKPKANPEAVSSKTPSEVAYPGVASRAYRSEAKKQAVATVEEAPVQEQPVEDAQESITE